MLRRPFKTNHSASCRNVLIFYVYSRDYAPIKFGRHANMILNILILIAGLALVLIGAEGLVGGASSLARKLGISEFVIGLTIVALGTSAPEMVVSFIGAAQGNGDISIGNIIGSNIFNTGLILGITCLLCPVIITKSNLRMDIPINIVATLLLVVMGMSMTLFHFGGGDILGRGEGTVLLLAFVAYMVYSFVVDKNSDDAQDEEDEKNYSVWVSALFVIVGLVALIFGGRLFVTSAEAIAKEVGLSDKFIAITILAAGTSLPELATSIVAAAKGKGQMALGNVLGSNTFNILLILGGSAMINPIAMSNINWVDLGAFVALPVLVFICSIFSRKGLLGKVPGALLTALWLAYMAWLIIKL